MEVTVERVITILGFLGIPSIIAVVCGFNSMMLMDPVSFTFEELDKREKYVILSPIGSASFALFILTIIVFILVAVSYIKTGKDVMVLAFFEFIIFLILSILLFVINFFKMGKYILGNDLLAKLCNALLFYFSGLFLIARVIIYKLSMPTDTNSQESINLGWNVLLPLIISIVFIVGSYIYSVYTLYSKFSIIINLSYLYYEDGGKKMFIFNRFGDSWLCSLKRDYIRCSRKEKKEFENKIKEYKNDTKRKVINEDTRSQILEYIDKLNRYSDYIRVDNEVVKKYLNIIRCCICNTSINTQIQVLNQKIDEFNNMIELRLISNDEITKKTLCHHLDNKDKFYNM